jgi:membrane associated rhomboid family serine protease
VNYALIILNIVVFIFLQGMGGNEVFTYAFSTVPAEIITGKDIVTQAKLLLTRLPGNSSSTGTGRKRRYLVYLTTITSMFMHGGWLTLWEHALPCGYSG